MNDLISIIVPVYNVEKYLRECLDSILNQTYKNIEVIVINDGSTDNSRNICDEYQKKDNRLKVINQKNCGLSATRNKGIKESRGKYLSFIDSDDVINHNMIELLHKELIKNKCDIAICKFNYFTNKFKEKNKEYKIEILNQDQFLKSLLIDKEIASQACNKLYKKGLFNNIKYPLGKIYEDIGTTYKLGLQANKIIYLNIELYGYRQRNNSYVNNLKKTSLIDYIEMTDKRYNDLLKIKPHLKNYLDMNKINTTTRAFLEISKHNKKEFLIDKELKQLLDKELLLSKRLINKETIKISTLKENIINTLLQHSTNLFFKIMSNLYKIKIILK